MRFLRKLGQRGVVTLPSEVRDAMELSEGDIVEFEVVSVVRRSKPAAPVNAEGPSERANIA